MNDRQRRLCMNTLLMNARIFDENSSEENSLDNSLKKNVKQEPEDNFDYAEPKNEATKANFSFQHENIKEEPEVMDDDSRSNFPCNVFEKLDLKKEYITPVKLEIEDNDNKGSTSRKNVKRTVFPRESPYKRDESNALYSRRESPYKREESNALYTRRESPYKTRQSPYKRLDQQTNPETLEKQKRVLRQRKNVEMETDPETLRRRQKQIDYGKNTVAYDVYSKTVPRSKRELTDPQTPDKYHKYSRRGFDGLIKQWRLKLHKYDPPEENEEV